MLHCSEGPAQTVFVQSFNPFGFGQTQQQQAQAPPQQEGQEQRRGGFWGNLLHYGGIVANGLLEGLLQPQINSVNSGYQQSPFSAFNGNPRDLFGDASYSAPQQGQHQHHQGPHRHIIFELNPMNLMFGGGGQGQAFFSPADYERLVEEFIRDDNNSYGAPPASQDNVSKLQEFDYAPGKCKAIDCTVCQEDYNHGDKLVNLPCNHTYHKDCVTEWLKRHDACPICRKSLNGQDTTQQQQQQQRPQQQRPQQQRQQQSNSNANYFNTHIQFGF